MKILFGYWLHNRNNVENDFHLFVRHNMIQISEFLNFRSEWAINSKQMDPTEIFLCSSHHIKNNMNIFHQYVIYFEKILNFLRSTVLILLLVFLSLSLQFRRPIFSVRSSLIKSMWRQQNDEKYGCYVSDIVLLTNTKRETLSYRNHFSRPMVNN